MSSNPEPNINWDPYMNDIISVYITRNKTAEETIKYLREKHGLHVTLRQFKYKFGGKKNITEKEWTTGIIPAIRKRALEGKESDVYFHGDKLNPKRLKRGIDRYVADVSRDFKDLDTSTVIGQNFSDRLCVVTPPCHSASPLINPYPEIHQDFVEVALPETPAHMLRCVSSGSVVLASPSRWRSFFLHDDGDLRLSDFNDDLELPFGTSNTHIEHVPEAHVPESIGNAFALMSTDGLSESLGPDTILGVSQYTLILNLPYFELKHSIPQSTNSLEIVDHLRFSLPLDGSSPNGSFDVPMTTTQPSNDLPSMLAKVIGFHYNGQIADVIPSFVKKLQALVPERYPGELNAQVQALPDPSQKPSVFQIFEVAAYFSSNNMLTKNQVAIFVKWVIEHRHVKSLTLFLRLRRDMLTVKAFLYTLVEASALVQNKNFLQQLHAIGAKFDHVAEQLVENNDMEFASFVLSTLDPELLKGKSGGHLLRSVARTKHIALAELLIQAGAEVNLSLLSARLQYIDLLIHAGANVNIEGLLDDMIYEEDRSPVVEKLIGAGFDLKSYGRRVTPFQAAALSLDLEHLQYAFHQGAEVNKPAFPVRGYTALQAAAKDRSIEKIEFLLSVGADVNAPPAVTGGVTALEATVRPYEEFSSDAAYDDEEHYEERGVLETFIFLLSEVRTVNRPDGSSSPLLHDIIERRNTHLLELALEAGANTTHRWGTLSSSWCERTPLQLASEIGQVEAVKLLLEHKADPNALPAHDHGMTALQAAASSETACIETVELLLAAGAAINAGPAAVGGITALQGAAIKGHFQIAILLIEKGANVNAPPAIKDGRTAIEGAAEHGRLDMVQMLLNAGAIGDVIRKTGLMKAISLAEKNRHFAVIDLLESHGRAKEK
ncbi:hypothetical protein TrVGV298_002410 [Trichoderma virens]|nr:hypothetical protein TrVGV298_002410 [Trichoderma virens]